MTPFLKQRNVLPCHCPPTTIPVQDSEKHMEQQQQQLLRSSEAIDPSSPSDRSRIWLVLLGAGMVLCQFLRGQSHEKLYKDLSFAFPFLQDALEQSFALSACILYIMWKRRFRTDLPILWLCGTGALLSVVKTTGSVALARGVPYFVVTVAKCAKMVPVMMGQRLLGGDSFTVRKQLEAALIVVGALMLTLGQVQDNNSSAKASSLSGSLILILSVLLDGVVAGLQQKTKMMMEGREKMSALDFMFWTTLPGCFSSWLLAMWNGDLRKGARFLVRHPEASECLYMVILCGFLGLMFLFAIVARYSPLAVAKTATFRKVLSVSWSIFHNGYQLTRMGYLGLFAAFGGFMLGF